jgi:tetratricopeptide (TPR) repeat protein
LGLDYGYKALALQRKINPSQMHFIFNNIGCAYMQLNDLEKSREFLNKSLEGLKQSIANGTPKEKEVEAYLVYSNLAVVEREDKNYARALQMLHVYIEQCLRLKNTSGIILTYENLATVHNSLQQPDSSRFYSDKGIALAVKFNRLNELTYLYHNRGMNDTVIAKDSAIYYLEKSFNLGNKQQLNDAKLSSAKALANLYEDRNDYKKAIYHLHLVNLLSEQELCQQNKKKIELLEFENAQKIKEQEALARTQKRESILFFGIILLVHYQ